MVEYDLDVNVLILLRKERPNKYLMYTNLPRGLPLYRGKEVCVLFMTRRARLTENLAPDKVTQVRSKGRSRQSNSSNAG